MNKRVPALLVCALLAAGCASQRRRDRMSWSSTSAPSTQQQFDEGGRRIDEFKQELLKQEFAAVSFYTSDSKEQVTLKGRRGKLDDLEVTLWTGKRFEINEPGLGGSISATITSDEAEREFRELSDKLSSVVGNAPR